MGASRKTHNAMITSVAMLGAIAQIEYDVPKAYKLVIGLLFCIPFYVFHGFSNLAPWLYKPLQTAELFSASFNANSFKTISNEQEIAFFR